MQHFGLFGEHLTHSLSVPIHEIFFRLTGIHADYRLFEIPKVSFAEDASRIMQSLSGVNVTIPYKKDIIPLLTEVDPVAQEVGAVNTVLCRGSAFSGHNTDVAGFTSMLAHWSINPLGQDCYVLGTGGASLAAVAALRQSGAARVLRVSRQTHGAVPGDVVGYDILPEIFSGILVNCTPAGMFPSIDGCPINAGDLAIILQKCTGVVDMIYNPAETVLTRYAKSAGIPWCTGLYMLVSQAVKAEEIWQNALYPAELTDKILEELSK